MTRIINLKSTKRITFMGGIAAAVALFAKGSMFSDVRNSLRAKVSMLIDNNLTSASINKMANNILQYIASIPQQIALIYNTNSPYDIKEFISSGVQKLTKYAAKNINSSIISVLSYPASIANSCIDQLATAGFISEENNPYRKYKQSLGIRSAFAGLYKNEADESTASICMSAITCVTLVVVSLYTACKIANYVVEKRQLAKYNKDMKYLDSLGSAAHATYYAYGGDYLPHTKDSVAQEERRHKYKPSSTVHAQGADCIQSPEIAMQRA